MKAVKEPGEEVGENPEDSGVTGGGGRGGAAAPTDIKKGGFVYVCVGRVSYVLAPLSAATQHDCFPVQEQPEMEVQVGLGYHSVCTCKCA